MTNARKCGYSVESVPSSCSGTGCAGESKGETHAWGSWTLEGRRGGCGGGGVGAGCRVQRGRRGTTRRFGHAARVERHAVFILVDGADSVVVVHCCTGGTGTRRRDQAHS